MPLPGQDAELGARLLARVVDALLVAALLFPLLTAGIVADGAQGALVAGLAGFVLAASFDAAGGTPGKRLLRLRVVNAVGGRPGLAAGAARNLWLLTSLLPTVVGDAVAVATAVSIAITIARSAASLGWHDRIAGTAVRHVPRRVGP